MDVTNSSKEVPKATIVKPTNIFETLKFAATELVPSTKYQLPLLKA